MSEKHEVYKITLNGGGQAMIVSTMKEVIETMETFEGELAEGDSINVECIMMTGQELNALGEFTGW